jgi:cell fate (sporulation/competence/biofilm development) regulator YlbF (YheA/YmcA/DUF963 family)
MEIEYKVQQFVEEIIGTKEFAALKQAQNVLKGNTQLQNQVVQFFKDHGEMHECKRQGKEFSLRSEQLSHRFSKLMQSQESAVYFKKSEKFNDFMLEIHGLIDEMVDRALNEK